jgi:hypothetical protein
LIPPAPSQVVEIRTLDAPTRLETVAIAHRLAPDPLS